MISRSIALLVVLVVQFVSNCCASLFLPAIFSDHMVLQCEKPVPVWGMATPGALVTVEFKGQKKVTDADSSGFWKVVLDPMVASSRPLEMSVKASQKSEFETLIFFDVLIGEVWFCAGQSNMQMAFVRQKPGGPVCDNGESEAAEADFPRIRLFNTPRKAAAQPNEKIDAQWQVCTPESIKMFSACAYYFGRKLHQDLDIPVGLILCAWGSTRIEAWIPPCGYEGDESLSYLYEKVTQSINLPKVTAKIPGAIYYGMYAAHIPFSIRGAVWYQGENNRWEGMRYVDKTKALLRGWHKLWGYEFPFYFVQIGAYNYDEKTEDMLPLFWEAQSEIAKAIPNTGMVVITDVSTLDNVHPPDKKTPGERLALLAEAKTYGMDVVCTGPEFLALEKDGNQLKVIFSSATGLTTRDSKSPDNFEIAGPDGVYKSALAEIEGQSVLLHSPDVPNPQSVRFAWNKLAQPNLINAAGLPTAAFREDIK